MNLLIASPFLIPLTFGVVLCSFRNSPTTRWAASFVALVGLCVLSLLLFFLSQGPAGPLVTQVGGWPAPFGITLVIDSFSALMLAVSALIGSSVLCFQFGERAQQKEHYHSLVLFLFAGVNGSFIAGDLFNLYVCFEIMVMSSFVLLVQNLEGQQVTSAIRYVTANLFASLLFLTGVGIIYGLSGRLNLAELSLFVRSDQASMMVTVAGMLLLFAFAIKSALFPVFQWLPHSYPAVPPALGALFAGLLTKVGIYGIFRSSSLLFPNSTGLLQEPLLWVSGATMLTGVLAAASQKNVRSILSFHIISQVGYMVLGIATFTLTGFFGTVYYLLHHIIVKSNLFLIAAVIERKFGSSDLDKLGGLAKESPWLAFCFLAPALALAGMPPFSGFIAKLLVIKAGLEIQAYGVAGLALLVGLITLYSMSKIWNAAFWSPKPVGVRLELTPPTMVIPIVLLSLLSLLIGLGYPWIAPLLQISAEDLINGQSYIEAVLGGRN